MEEILRELHAGEQREVEKWRQSFIDQINEAMSNARDLETKVKILCNVTAKIFMERRDWLMITPHQLEIVEAVVTDHWNGIKEVVTRELREVHLNRSVANADDETANGFYSLADKILPLN